MIRVTLHRNQSLKHEFQLGMKNMPIIHLHLLSWQRFFFYPQGFNSEAKYNPRINFLKELTDKSTSELKVCLELSADMLSWSQRNLLRQQFNNYKDTLKAVQKGEIGCSIGNES